MRLADRLLIALLLSAMLGGCMGSSGSDSDSGDSDSGGDTTVIGAAPVAGSIDSADGEEQLFAYAAPADGVYNVALDWFGPSSDLDLFITDGVDSYFTLAHNGTAESVNIAMLQGEVLAIAVSAFATGGAQAYTIGVTAVSAPAHSPGHVESEPNDTSDIGVVIGFGQGSGIVNSGSDLDDTYVFVVPQTATYVVRVEWSNNLRDLDLAIFWGTSGFAQSIQMGTESETIIQALDMDDQLRILVRGFDTGGTPVSYNLTVAAQ